jgi:hypothetical protein
MKSGNTDQIARGKAEFTLSDRRRSELRRAYHQFSNSQLEDAFKMKKNARSQS